MYAAVKKRKERKLMPSVTAILAIGRPKILMLLYVLCCCCFVLLPSCCVANLLLLVFCHFCVAARTGETWLL